jgi:hypothetical protein
MAWPSAVELSIENCGTWTNYGSRLDARFAINIQDGRQNIDTRVASVGSMSFRLLNSDNKFTPGHASADPNFVEGVRLRFRVTVDFGTYTVVYQVFNGRLGNIHPLELQGIVECIAYDGMYEIERASVNFVAPAASVMPGTLVEDVLEGVYHPPQEIGHIVWNHPCSGWGLASWSQPFDGWSIDPGVYAFPWVGDVWREDQVSSQRALEDICDSELAYASVQADGYFLFDGRTRRAQQVSIIGPSFAFTRANIVGLDDVHSIRRKANYVEARVYPRTQDSSIVVLWRTGDQTNLVLPHVGEIREIHAHWRDPSQEAVRVAAWEVEALVASTDYATTPTGYESYLHFYVEAGATGARITMYVTATLPTSVRLDWLQVRGKLLRAFTPYVAVAADWDDYAVQPLPLILDMPLQSDISFADQAALFYLAQRRDAPETLTLRCDGRVSRDELVAALSLDKGSYVTVTDASSALNGGYFIESRHLVFDAAGAAIYAYFHCTPASEYRSFVWGYSAWNGTAGWGL